MHWSVSVVAATALLSSCTPPSAPAPALDFVALERPDAQHVRAVLNQIPAAAVWTIRRAQECGAADGPARSGPWPSGERFAVLEGARGDLLTITAQGTRLVECVPPLGGNTAQGV